MNSIRYFVLVTVISILAMVVVLFTQFDPDLQNKPTIKTRAESVHHIPKVPYVPYTLGNEVLPIRFFIYDNHLGRLNNQLTTMINSLYWSKLSKRILVVPGWDEILLKDKKSIAINVAPVEKYFNFEYLRDNFPHIVTQQEFMQNEEPHNLHKHLKVLGGTNFQYTREFTRDSLGKSLLIEDAKYLAVELPYRWAIPPDNFTTIISYFRPAQHLVDIAESWMASNLKKPFAGLHLRRREGECKMSMEELSGIIDKGLTEHKLSNMFLASDHQDRNLTHKIAEKYQSPRFDLNVDNLGIYASGIIDGYILSSSELYFANIHSELSRNWFLYRYSTCKHQIHRSDCVGNSNSMKEVCYYSRNLEKYCQGKFTVIHLRPKEFSQGC